MRRSQYRRSQNWFSGRRRLVAAVATLVAFGGIITVTQVSNASTRANNRSLASCDNIKAPSANQANFSTKTKRGTYSTDGGRNIQHADDGQEVPTAAQLRSTCRKNVLASTKAGQGNGKGGGNNNGGGNNAGGLTNGDKAPGFALGVLANNCSQSKFSPHTGFQEGPHCVSTEFGEVSDADHNPSLLITEAPAQVGVNQPFALKVATRHMKRDRFLGAAAGGYYVESALLDGNQDTRGHFHTACRMLDSLTDAPIANAVPAFFTATEDGGGKGGQSDTVVINVPGLPQNGVAQCASWAGDGSHRIPMMQNANLTPAFDVVKIKVGNGGGNGGGNNGGGNNGGGNNGGGNNGNNGAGNGNNVKAGTAQARPKTINCPTVADKVGQIPGAAQSEVMRNLALLDTQIKEAQQRLLTSADQGGAAFVQNAILGPLAGKRGSTLDRIRLAIQRAGGQAPNGLAGLAGCTAV